MRLALLLLAITPAFGAKKPTAQQERLQSLLLQEKGLIADSKDKDTPELRKRMADLRADIAQAEYDAGSVGAAQAYLENSLGIDPQRADRWSMLGDLREFSGKPASRLLACAAYEKALEIDPERESSRQKLAAAYLAGGRFLKALEQFERIVKKQDKPDGRNAAPMAAAYALTRQAGRGAAFLETAHARAADPRFLIAAAALRRQNKESGAAVALLRRAQSEAKDDKALSDYILDLRREYADPEAGK